MTAYARTDTINRLTDVKWYLVKVAQYVTTNLGGERSDGSSSKKQVDSHNSCGARGTFLARDAPVSAC